MKFQRLIPVINCQHIKETLAFYQQALGYVVLKRENNSQGNPRWLYIKSDNTELMLIDSSDNKPKKPVKSDIITLYYYTDDVDTRYNFLLAKGFQPGKVTTTDYGMREIILFDPEGNKLIIGQY